MAELVLDTTYLLSVFSIGVELEARAKSVRFHEIPAEELTKYTQLSEKWGS